MEKNRQFKGDNKAKILFRVIFMGRKKRILAGLPNLWGIV